MSETGTSLPSADALADPAVRIVIGSVAVLLLLASLDQSIVATALPTIVADLGGLDHPSRVVTAYILASTIVASLYGKMSDIHGRRTMMFLSVGLFLLGSATCGLANSMTTPILARGLQGLGGGGLMELAMAIAGDIIPPRERGRLQEVFAAVFATSSVAGPLLGGWFTEEISWHWIFYINIPIGALAVAGFAFRFAPQPRSAGRRIDYAGAIALSVFLGALVLVTSLGGRTLPWGGPAMVALIGLAVISLPAFLWIETRAAEPILPPELFRINTFTITCAVGFASGAGLLGAVTFLPIFLQIAQGASPTVSGIRMIPMMAGLLIAANVAGRVMRATGRYRILLNIGTVLLTAGLALLATLKPDIPVRQFGACLVVVGTGLGCIFPVTTTSVQNAVGRDRIGTATAANLMFRQVGGALAVALFGAMFAAAVASRLGDVMDRTGEIGPQMLADLPDGQRGLGVDAVAAGTRPIFAIAAILAAAGFVVSTWLGEIPLSASVDR